MELKKVAASIAIGMTLSLGLSVVPSYGTSVCGTAFAADRYVCDDNWDDEQPHIYLVEESVKKYTNDYGYRIKAKFKTVDRNTGRLLGTTPITFIFEEGSPAQYTIDLGRHPRHQYIYRGPNELKVILQACKDVLAGN